MNAFELNKTGWSRLLESKSRLAHAILLFGPAGILKTDLGYELAKALICEAPKASGESCGECSACKWFSLGNHPDFRWIKPDSMDQSPDDDATKKDSAKEKTSREITIDQVRGLADFLNLGTHRSGNRVILISPAEAMNRNTANALLKSLEEPRPGTQFILVSDQPDQLLPTIRSRCTAFGFQMPERDKAANWLKEQGVDTAVKWLDRAGGSPRIALNIATGHLGKLLKLLESSLGMGKKLDVISLATEIDRLLRAEKDVKASDVIDWTQRWMVDAALSCQNLKPHYFLDQEKTFREIFVEVNVEKLLSFNTESYLFKKLSQHTLNNRLFFEDFYSLYTRIFARGAP